MTVAQQLALSRKDEFVQKGAQHEKYEIAKNMLRKGYDDAEIIGLTGLGVAIIANMKVKIKH